MHYAVDRVCHYEKQQTYQDNSYLSLCVDLLNHLVKVKLCDKAELLLYAIPELHFLDCTYSSKHA